MYLAGSVEADFKCHYKRWHVTLHWFSTQTVPSYEKWQETQDWGGNAMEKTEDMSKASSMSTCQMTVLLVLDMLVFWLT